MTLIDCVKASASKWADKGDGWKLLLANPRALARPVPYKGSLNLFKVDHELVRDLLPA